MLHGVTNSSSAARQIRHAKFAEQARDFARSKNTTFDRESLFLDLPSQHSSSLYSLS